MRESRLPCSSCGAAVAARSLLRINQDRRGYYALMSGDRLVARAAADAVAAANPHWEYVVFDGVGHTPQLEVPDRFLDVAVSRLQQSGVLPGATRDYDASRSRQKPSNHQPLSRRDFGSFDEKGSE